MNASALLIAPYALWMALLSFLPSTPWAYALRTLLVAAALAYSAFSLRRSGVKLHFPSLTDWLWGVSLGLVVLVIWVWPEQFAWYRRWCIYGEGGTEAIAESSRALVAMRLLGSAFVISVAEELFFRKWLIGFAGFWPMVALFAIEHDRYVVGAIAGLIYGWLYLRKGLWSAIIAHAVTNLTLGLWVLYSGQWQFW